jgi:nicotinamidase-related amidase
MKSPLVVIDVQDSFIDSLRADKELYLDHVCKAVKKARSEERLVVLVQYQGEGPTNARVRKVLAGYKHRTIVYKRRNGGATEVHNRLQKLLPGAKRLTVCGVNLDCCVLETVQGLIWKGYACRIVRKATCNTWMGYYRPADDGWTRKNLSIAGVVPS